MKIALYIIAALALVWVTGGLAFPLSGTSPSHVPAFSVNLSKDLHVELEDGNSWTGLDRKISKFIAPYATRLFVAGLLLDILAGLWLLFASYDCDARIARLSYFFPFLTLRLVLTYPERCLAPFLLQHAALLFCVPQMLRFFQFARSIEASGSF
jgi:hypothetical protein